MLQHSPIGGESIDISSGPLSSSSHSSSLLHRSSIASSPDRLIPPPPPLFAASTSMPSLFYRHCLWLLVSAIFNISKFPERLAPGRFDIWGHSHQWFHCCTFLSILDELHMIKTEVRAILLSPTLLLPPATLSRLPGPTIATTYGVMLLLQTTIISIIVWFSWCANSIYGPERDRLAKEQMKKCLKCHWSHRCLLNHVGWGGIFAHEYRAMPLTDTHK